MTIGPNAGSGGIAYYTCSMHPSVHAHEPGTCPVCSMNLTPVLRSDEQSGVVRIDEARLRATGVRTEKAVKAPLTLDIRAVGKLTYDETRLQDVVLKVGGFLSGLRITAAGQPVKKGEALFQLYSPELYAAEQDYLVARSSVASGLARPEDPEDTVDMPFKSVFAAVVVGVALVVAALLVNQHRPRRDLAEPTAALVEASGKCAECQSAIGILGFGLHLAGDLARPTACIIDRFVFGAPAFAPLLFADLAALGAIALWATARAGHAEA